MLVFEEKINENKTAFVNKLNQIATRLNTNPNYLMAVMWIESRLNPLAPNQQTGAVGLIQFMPSLLAKWNLTTSYVLSLSNVEQLDLVEKYFKPYTGKLNSYLNVYLSVFFPAAIGKPDNWVFSTDKISSSKIAQQNPLFDTNKDGKITIAEFKNAILLALPKSVRNKLLAISIIPVLLLITTAYFILK